MAKTVEMLREFANFKSTGMRGIVRMLRMQEEARKHLEKLEKRRKSKEKPRPVGMKGTIQ